MDCSQSTTLPRNEVKNVTFEQEGEQNAILKGELYLEPQDPGLKRGKNAYGTLIKTTVPISFLLFSSTKW